MSKTRKSRKTQFEKDSRYGFEDEYTDSKPKKNKSQERRFERALKTRNINDLIDEDLELSSGDYE